MSEWLLGVANVNVHDVSARPFDSLVLLSLLQWVPNAEHQLHMLEHHLAIYELMLGIFTSAFMAPHAHALRKFRQAATSHHRNGFASCIRKSCGLRTSRYAAALRA